MVSPPLRTSATPWSPLQPPERRSNRRPQPMLRPRCLRRARPPPTRALRRPLTGLPLIHHLGRPRHRKPPHYQRIRRRSHRHRPPRRPAHRRLHRRRRPQRRPRPALTRRRQWLHPHPTRARVRLRRHLTRVRQHPHPHRLRPVRDSPRRETGRYCPVARVSHYGPPPARIRRHRPAADRGVLPIACLDVRQPRRLARRRRRWPSHATARDGMSLSMTAWAV
jgi:hypothetical protein